jgi:GNAT superfamily N-acetyltransferase
VKLGFASSWSIRATMVFDRLYHPNLQQTIAEKRDVLRHAIAVWMYDAGRGILIGEAYGTPADEADDDGEGYEDISHYRRHKAMYVYSTTILPRFQGRGLGKILKAHHLGRIQQAGYRYVIGHARDGASVALNLGFGAKLLTRHPDWHGTGDLYRFYELALRRARVHAASPLTRRPIPR